MDSAHIVDSALRGATGAMVAFAIALLLRDGANSWTAKTGTLFGVGVIAYLGCSAPWFEALPAPLFLLTLMFCIANPMLFWLFGRSLFDDDFQPRALDLWIVASLVTLGLVRYRLASAWPVPLQNMSLVVLQLVSIALVAHVFALALLGHRDDLVEARRRFRLLFVIGIGVYVLMLAVAEITFAGVSPPTWLETLNVGGLLLLAFGVAVSMARMRSEELVGTLVAPRPASGPKAQPQVANASAGHLEQCMRDSKAYLKEGLTIGALAEIARMPEYRLRQVINREMGFRNFTAFINHYRLAEAKTALSDPARAKVPVLTIALELGYGSIGPFNRAFKSDTGLTPTQFRQRMLGSVKK